MRIDVGRNKPLRRSSGNPTPYHAIAGTAPKRLVPAYRGYTVSIARQATTLHRYDKQPRKRAPLFVVNFFVYILPTSRSSSKVISTTVRQKNCRQKEVASRFLVRCSTLSSAEKMTFGLESPQRTLAHASGRWGIFCGPAVTRSTRYGLHLSHRLGTSGKLVSPFAAMRES